MRAWRGMLTLAMSLLLLASLGVPASALWIPVEFTALQFLGGSFDPSNSVDICTLTGAYTPVKEGYFKGHYDAYDGGLAIALNSDVFTDPDGMVDETNNIVKAGPATLNQLQVSRTHTVVKGGAILRDLVTITNPTGVQQQRVLTVASNFGTDADTNYETSSGDNLVTPADRWMFSAEGAPDENSDPVNTTVLYGAGTVDTNVSTVVTGVDGNDCLRVWMDVIVPANSTRYLLFFAEMHEPTMPGFIKAEDDVIKYNNVGLTKLLKAGLPSGVKSRVLNFNL